MSNPTTAGLAATIDKAAPLEPTAHELLAVEFDVLIGKLAFNVFHGEPCGCWCRQNPPAYPTGRQGARPMSRRALTEGGDVRRGADDHERRRAGRAVCEAGQRQ